MAKPQNDIEYGDRETLDAELNSAISDILSAEQEARHIVARAEESVKAIQLDLAVRERDMRKASDLATAELRDSKLKAAKTRAEAERAKLVAAAQAEGEALIKSKAKPIGEMIDLLYKSLGGKA